MIWKFILCCTFLHAFVAVYGQGDNDYLCENRTGEKIHVALPGSGCTRFITCTNGTASPPQRCAESTLFSIEKDYCDHEENVTCLDKGQGCHTRAVRGLCSNFTYCDSNNKPSNMNCGEGTVFSNTFKVCDYPYALCKVDKEECGIDTRGHVEPRRCPKKTPIEGQSASRDGQETSSDVQ